ncbi:hypothetical protein NL676_038700 [Syzygium grande]|nr:hypothetical protein NL676_038700 [Syzygium grande]
MRPSLRPASPLAPASSSGGGVHSEVRSVPVYLGFIEEAFEFVGSSGAISSRMRRRRGTSWRRRRRAAKKVEEEKKVQEVEMKDAEEENEEKSGAIGYLPVGTARGAAIASEPRMRKSIYEMGFSILNSTLILLEVYKHECSYLFAAQVFVVEWVEGQITYLEAQETTAVIDYRMRLLQLYSSHNIGKISLSHQAAYSMMQKEKYKDLRAARFNSFLAFVQKDPVVFYGLHIVTPLISLELLKYPKLCRDVSRVIHIIQEMDLGLAKDVQVH